MHRNVSTLSSSSNLFSLHSKLLHLSKKINQIIEKLPKNNNTKIIENTSQNKVISTSQQKIFSYFLSNVLQYLSTDPKIQEYIPLKKIFLAETKKTFVAAKKNEFFFDKKAEEKLMVLAINVCKDETEAEILCVFGEDVERKKKIKEKFCIKGGKVNECMCLDKCTDNEFASSWVRNLCVKNGRDNVEDNKDCH